MQKLPIGLQSFKEIREKDFLYVDKTKQVFNLVDRGKYYFLSRPRRFGKSLLLSTLKHLYQGDKDLFKGLWIGDKWNWEKKNPVLHISFNNVGHQDIGLRKALEVEIDRQADKFNITLTKEGIHLRFTELLQTIAKQGNVVLLIDEYDKPIIDYLGGEEATASANIKVLKSFYSVIKNNDDYIEFFLITGISKFSKVGIFSDLNNLTDITLNKRFSDICGYTETELRHYFTAYCSETPDEDFWQKIRYWYNGYTWDLKTYVYNPFSILSYFNEEEFRNFWFQTGTPTFLIKVLKNHFFYDFEHIKTGQSAFESYDFEDIEAVPLLFQTGYLTLIEKDDFIYKLGYPNHEVKMSMLQHLVKAFRHSRIDESSALVYDIRKAFLEDDIERVIECVNIMFSTIPNQIFMADKERYYHSLVHLLFTFLGIYIESEVNTHRGRMDAVVQTSTHIYILEFKLNKSTKEAIEQIKSRSYAQKYKNSGKNLLGIGINFNSETKDVENFEVVDL